jgi:hypothetical protein
MERSGQQPFHLDVRFCTSLIPGILERLSLDAQTSATLTRSQVTKKHAWVNLEVYGTTKKVRDIIQLCRRWGGVVRILDPDLLCA